MCEIWSEIAEGGWSACTALLSPVTGLGLTLGSALAIPAYLANIAWRLARRLARVSSTGGGDGGMSSSISGNGSGAGCGLADDEDGRVPFCIVGLCRGDILRAEYQAIFGRKIAIGSRYLLAFFLLFLVTFWRVMTTMARSRRGHF